MPKPRSIEDIQAAQGKPVKVGSVTQQDLALSQTFYGTIRPFAEANVQGKYKRPNRAVKSSGRRYSVKAGEVIVKFDQKDLATATATSAIRAECGAAKRETGGIRCKQRKKRPADIKSC